MNDPTYPSVPVQPPDDQLLPVLPEETGQEKLRKLVNQTILDDLVFLDDDTVDALAGLIVRVRLHEREQLRRADAEFTPAEPEDLAARLAEIWRRRETEALEHRSHGEPGQELRAAAEQARAEAYRIAIRDLEFMFPPDGHECTCTPGSDVPDPWCPTHLDDDQLLPVLPEREQLRRSCGNCQGSDPAHVYGELVLCWSCADRATCPECGRIDKPLLDSPAEACGACQDDDTACPCGASPIVGLSHGELVCGPCFKDHQAASAALSGGRYHPVAINPDGQDDDTAPGVTR